MTSSSRAGRANRWLPLRIVVSSKLKKCSMFRQDSGMPTVREKDFVRDCVLEFDSFVVSWRYLWRPEMLPEGVGM
jgi:hypothetical protein